MKLTQDPRLIPSGQGQAVSPRSPQGSVLGSCRAWVASQSRSQNEGWVPPLAVPDQPGPEAKGTPMLLGRVGEGRGGVCGGGERCALGAGRGVCGGPGGRGPCQMEAAVPGRKAEQARGSRECGPQPWTTGFLFLMPHLCVTWEDYSLRTQDPNIVGHVSPGREVW